jgi:hypothetical protein
MRIPGFLRNNLFYLRILVILSALSIGSQIFKTEDNTWDVNTFGPTESLEVRVGELEVRVTGRSTTARVMNLIEKELKSGTLVLNERY